MRKGHGKACQRVDVHCILHNIRIYILHIPILVQILFLVTILHHQPKKKKGISYKGNALFSSSILIVHSICQIVAYVTRVASLVPSKVTTCLLDSSITNHHR